MGKTSKRQLGAPAGTREQAREWFRDAKFGMFIHWGVYALLGKGEWIRNVDQIPPAEYAELPPKFEAKKFDAKLDPNRDRGE